MRQVWSVMAIVCAALSTATAANAQVGAGQVTGIVKDADGAAVPGAVVTVTNTATNTVRQSVSSSAGIYAAVGLAPGIYRLDLELSGFRPVHRDGLKVETGT